MACCSVSIREPTVTLFQCNEAEIINCTFQAMKPPFPLQAPMGGCEIDESNSRRLNNMIADFDMFGLFFEKWTKMYVFPITFNKHPSKLVLTPLWWGWWWGEKERWGYLFMSRTRYNVGSPRRLNTPKLAGKTSARTPELSGILPSGPQEKKWSPFIIT